MDADTTAPNSPAEESSPNKYIRTFAGDMDMFKKGGIPDLAPFGKSQPAPAERKIEEPPVIPAPSPVGVSISAEAPSVQPTSGPAESVPELTPIETYAADFSQRMEEKNASTVTVLAAEQDSASRVQKSFQKESPKNTLYIGSGVLLLLISGVGIYLAYARYTAVTAPVMTAPVAVTPIFVDSREQISGTGAALMQAIEQSVAKPLAQNSVRLLSLADTSATASVFSSLNVHVPGILIRNIEPTGSMAGIVNVHNNSSPFFILSVTTYGSAFSGMLSWESTMPSDLVGLFPPYSAMIAAAPMIATTTIVKSAAATSTPTIRESFRDEVVSNHDVRTYRDSSGRSVLLYGFWNQATLIIARDPAAFTEIVGRLATSHTR